MKVLLLFGVAPCCSRPWISFFVMWIGRIGCSCCGSATRYRRHSINIGTETKLTAAICADDSAECFFDRCEESLDMWKRLSILGVVENMGYMLNPANGERMQLFPQGRIGRIFRSATVDEKWSKFPFIHKLGWPVKLEFVVQWNLKAQNPPPLWSWQIRSLQNWVWINPWWNNFQQLLSSSCFILSHKFKNCLKIRLVLRSWTNCPFQLMIFFIHVSERRFRFATQKKAQDFQRTEGSQRVEGRDDARW